MRCFLSIVFIIVFSSNVFSQFAFNVPSLKLKDSSNLAYKIVQYQEGEITKIKETNKKGQTIFELQRGDKPPFFKWENYQYFVRAFEYDTKGRRTKKIDFNSNSGLDIYSYTYDEEKKSKVTYKRSFLDKNKEINTNPYSNISRFKSFQDVLNSDEVLKINSAPKVKMYFEKFNEKKKVVEGIFFNPISKDTTLTVFTYNERGLEVKKEVFKLPSNELSRIVIKEHPYENAAITRISGYRNGKEAYKYIFADYKDEVNNSKTDFSERRGKLNIRHCIFDEYNNVKRIVVYETKYSGKLIIPISNDFEKIAEMNYRYNEKGLLESERMINYKTRKKEVRKYKYKIEEL